MFFGGFGEDEKNSGCDICIVHVDSFGLQIFGVEFSIFPSARFLQLYGYLFDAERRFFYPKVDNASFESDPLTDRVFDLFQIEISIVNELTLY